MVKSTARRARCEGNQKRIQIAPAMISFAATTNRARVHATSSKGTSSSKNVTTGHRCPLAQPWLLAGWLRKIYIALDQLVNGVSVTRAFDWRTQPLGTHPIHQPLDSTRRPSYCYRPTLITASSLFHVARIDPSFRCQRRDCGKGGHYWSRCLWTAMRARSHHQASS
jgi:hypothetical protein